MTYLWNIWSFNFDDGWHISDRLEIGVPYTADWQVAHERIAQALGRIENIVVESARPHSDSPLVHLRFFVRGRRPRPPSSFALDILPPLFAFYDLRGDPDLGEELDERPILYVQPELLHEKGVVFQGKQTPPKAWLLAIDYEVLKRYPNITVALDHFLETGRPLRGRLKPDGTFV